MTMTPAIVPPTMTPMFGPSPLSDGFVEMVAPDTPFFTQEADTQLRQSPSDVTQSSSDLHDGHCGAIFGHCTQRLNKECEAEKSSAGRVSQLNVGLLLCQQADSPKGLVAMLATKTMRNQRGRMER